MKFNMFATSAFLVLFLCASAAAVAVCPAGQEVDCNNPSQCMDCGEGLYSTTASSSCTNCVACSVTDSTAVPIPGVTQGTSFQTACTYNSPPPPPPPPSDTIASVPSPTPIATPAATTGGGDKTCFPESATVDTPAGRKLIGALSRGDKARHTYRKS